MRLTRSSTSSCLALFLVWTVVAWTVLVGPQDAAVAAACASGQVALTFDDGPSATFTPRFENVLRDRRVPAVFFVVGENVRRHPGVTRRASALGFTVGNHTYSHENLTRLSDAAIMRTLRRTRRAIVAAGARPSPLVRPSYGATNPRVDAVIRSMGFVPVLWNVDPRDWDGRSASRIVSSTLAQLKPGRRNIVLLHDGVRNSDQTLLALPALIRRVRARGYCLVR